MALSELMASVVSGIEIVPPSAAIELAVGAFAGAAAVIACAGDAAFALWPITSREMATTDAAGKIKITRPIFMKPTFAFRCGMESYLSRTNAVMPGIASVGPLMWGGPSCPTLDPRSRNAARRSLPLRAPSSTIFQLWKPHPRHPYNSATSRTPNARNQTPRHQAIRNQPGGNQSRDHHLHPARRALGDRLRSALPHHAAPAGSLCRIHGQAPRSCPISAFSL